MLNFLTHSAPKAGGNQPAQRNFNRNPPLIRMPPPPADNYAHGPSGRGPLLPLPPHPPAPLLPLPNPAESSWERGVRSAKRMVAESSKRKEQDVDFDDKRVNQGLDEEPYYHRHGPHHSRSPSPRRGHDRRSASPYRDYRDYPPPPPLPPPPSHPRDRHNREYNSEYERRHRLAFESAPWNEEPAPRSPRERSFDRSRGAAEQYRDPWRRSPNSPSRNRGADREAGFPKCGDGSKRSYSMSSISGSDSASDLSGSSDLSDSSSGSFSDNSAKKKKPLPKTKNLNKHRQPPKDVLPRGTQPDVSLLPRIPKLNRPRDQPSMNKHGSDSGGKPDRKRENQRDDYDSWNDTDSSASESGSDEEHRSRRHYRTHNEKSESKSTKRPSQEPSKAETLSKRPRKSTESGRTAASQSPHSAQSSPPSVRNTTSPDRGSPHKKDSNPGFSMKFNKKVSGELSSNESID